MNNNIQYLIFSIESEKYGIKIEKIKEIIRYEKITMLADSKDYLRGVINLRGTIIPIIDMKLKFNMSFKDYTDRTVFIITNVEINGENQLIGLAVDNVYDVNSINQEQIQPPPKIGLNKKSDYLEGIAKVGEDMVLLLNIDRILTSDEIINIKERI